MNGYLLDTTPGSGLRPVARKSSNGMSAKLERSQAHRQVFVSAISVLELARLVALGQRTLPCSIDDFVAQAFGEGMLLLLDLTPNILIDSTRLLGAIHRDPADRLLVATARAHGLALVTRDKQLLAYANQGYMNARKP